LIGEKMPGAKIETVEERWQGFRAMVYPDVDQSSEQMRQLRMVWFSAYLDCLGHVQEVSAVVSEDDAVEVLKGIHNEVEGACLSYAREANRHVF